MTGTCPRCRSAAAKPETEKGAVKNVSSQLLLAKRTKRVSGTVFLHFIKSPLQERQTACFMTFSSKHTVSGRCKQRKALYIKGLKHFSPTLFVHPSSCFKEDKNPATLDSTSVAGFFTNSFCPITLKTRNREMQDSIPRFSFHPKQQKKPYPSSSQSAKSGLLVRLQGLEPWTNRLRVYCSTN